MKFLSWFGHPLAVIISYLLILISAENMGGFYLLYILLGLAYGAPHAFAALAGVVLVLIGYGFPRRLGRNTSLLSLLGIGLMLIALFLFFYHSWNVNRSGFSQALPLFTLVLFGLCAICFVLLSFRSVVRPADTVT